MHLPSVSVALVCALLLAACQGGTPSGGSSAAEGGGASAAHEPAAAATYDDHGDPKGLHNFHKLTDKVTSGAQPEGEEAFRNLKALGFTTIVSVDGARPELELAEKYGLRYVHVPMQYSGVKPEEQLEMAKAVEIASGPVYIHCHHGKHRSPAAAAAVCIDLGLVTTEQGTAFLKTAGTDPKYQGLYRDVAAAKPLPADVLAKASTNFRAYVKPGDLAAAMVDVDLRWEHLKASKAAQWGVPADSPDVDPPHEARMLWEHYRELARMDESKAHGERFLSLLAEGEAAAVDLENALRAKDPAAAATAFDRSNKACSSCHKAFRDN
jgi:protein tyrosine phosphatase (PTP) superfamily phosphohydrolase (DUF442 family)